jgi:hypothetical protein
MAVKSVLSPVYHRAQQALIPIENKRPEGKDAKKQKELLWNYLANIPETFNYRTRV